MTEVTAVVNSTIKKKITINTSKHTLITSCNGYRSGGVKVRVKSGAA